MCYVVIEFTLTTKKVVAVFGSLEAAGEFARMNSIQSWHVEAVPYLP